MQSRKFTRHPLEIALTIKPLIGDALVPLEEVYSKNVSSGGLAFTSTQTWEIGTIVSIVVMLTPSFEFLGRVAWCESVEDNPSTFEVGIEFMAKKANVLESALQIQSYQTMVQTHEKLKNK
jgi:Tfp pilus assembly protein PilZ